MVSFIEVVIAIGVSIAVGIIVGKLARKEQREKCCPYCCCKEHCNIGQGVEQKCSDEELRPFVCGVL